MRSIAAAKSTLNPPGTFTPNRQASRTAAEARAATMTPLDGTQPTCRQSPPMSRRSTSATFAPKPAATDAATSPAVPAPSTTKW